MKDEFIKEFHALLEKYNVSIGFSVSSCSDTHGLYDEKMVVEYNDRESWLEIDGWCISAYDLRLLKND